MGRKAFHSNNIFQCVAVSHALTTVSLEAFTISNIIYIKYST